MFKVNNKNTRTTSEAVLMFLLLTFNTFHNFFHASIVEIEQVNVSLIRA